MTYRAWCDSQAALIRGSRTDNSRPLGLARAVSSKNGMILDSQHHLVKAVPYRRVLVGVSLGMNTLLIARPAKYRISPLF